MHDPNFSSEHIEEWKQFISNTIMRDEEWPRVYILGTCLLGDTYELNAKSPAAKDEENLIKCMSKYGYGYNRDHGHLSFEVARKLDIHPVEKNPRAVQ